MTRTQFIRGSVLGAAVATIAATLAFAGPVGPHSPTAAAANPEDGGRVAYAIIDGERAEVPDIAMGEAAVVEAIIEEGSQRNRVMEHLTHLCDEIGPRLTG